MGKNRKARKNRRLTARRKAKERPERRVSKSGQYQRRDLRAE